MAATSHKRSRLEVRGPPKRKKARRQSAYHSSSEDESDQDEQLEEPQENVEVDQPEQSAEQEEEEQSEANDSGSPVDSEADDSDASSTGPRGVKRKRNDPTAFATSMSKILSSKLSTSKRSDPVLSRSKDAADAVKELNESRLEARAKRQIRSEKKEKLHTGRIKDVKGLDTPDISTQELIEAEKKLKKIAQRGVVKLFNAVRAAQIKGEEAAREARRAGVVGIDKREEQVNEMSKKGFLDLIASGGKK